MAHWDPGKVLEPSIGWWGPCRALRGCQSAAVLLISARIPHVPDYTPTGLRLPPPPECMEFQVRVFGMAHWDPGKVLEPSIGWSGPRHALRGCQSAAVAFMFARIPMYFFTIRVVSGRHRPPSAWNFRSECLGWFIGTQGRYQNRQSGGRGHVVRSGGANRPLCRWCLSEICSIWAKGSDSSPATPAPRVHGISGLSVWDGSLGPRDGIRTVNRVVGAMWCARDDGNLRSYGLFSKSMQMSIFAHFGPNWTKTSFLTKIFFRKWLHLFRHPQISLVEVCSLRFWGGRRSTTNDGCSGS